MDTETAVSADDSADLQKVFVDREDQRNFFNKKSGKILTDGNRLIYCTVVGGVDKIALIRELSRYLQIALKVQKFKHIGYDFNYYSEMLTALNALKKLLTDKHEV